MKEEECSKIKVQERPLRLAKVSVKTSSQGAMPTAGTPHDRAYGRFAV